jgi:hypothetical protein
MAADCRIGLSQGQGQARACAPRLPADPRYRTAILSSFYSEVTGPKCFCEWRLAIDWAGRGRSDEHSDHGFGKIRSDTADYKDRTLYQPQDVPGVEPQPESVRRTSLHAVELGKRLIRKA